MYFTCLTTSTPNKLKSFQFTKDLGTDRPKIIMDIETLLFRVLVKIVCGEIDSLQAVQEIVHLVPWDKVDTVDPEVDAYFSASEQSLSSSLLHQYRLKIFL